MARKTANRMADNAASIGYQNGWRDAHESLTPRMAEMEDRIEELEGAIRRVMLHKDASGTDAAKLASVYATAECAFPNWRT